MNSLILLDNTPRFDERQVFVPYCFYEEAMKRYPKRKVDATPYCEDDRYYVYSKRINAFLTVKIADGSIWAGIYEPMNIDIHRWRYANIEKQYGVKYIIDYF